MISHIGSAAGLLAVIVVLSVGCGRSESALEQRTKEFQYSTATLASELAGRLNTAAKTQRLREVHSRRRTASLVDPDRGVDEGRPDPLSIEAIAADAAIKVQNVSDASKEVATTGEKLVALIQRESTIRSDVKAEFITNFKAELDQLATASESP